MPREPRKPLEGREQELEVLLERWKLACEGAGQVVLVSAEAGLGKSRLVEELADRTSDGARVFLTCRCSPRRRTTAFAPLLDLQQRLEAESDHGVQGPAGATDPGERVRATVAARLQALLSPPRQSRQTALNLNPEGQAKKTLELLLELLKESAKRHPLLLVVEDLEWIDPSTLELLTLLIHRRISVRLMAVLTFAPPFAPPWSHRAHLTSLELPRLSRQQEEVLLDRLMGEEALDADLKRRLVALADGVPLFVEELARLAADPRRRDAGGAAPAIPLTLKHWLTARLEPLGEALEVARQAAAFGRELSYEELRAVSTLGEPRLREALDRLVEAGVLVPAGAGYAFRHVLLCEALHESLLGRARRETHRRIAEALESSFPEVAGAEPERLAHHYAEAGMTARAVAAWRDAAEQAVRASANLEAAERARRGLELLESLPESGEARALAVALHIVLGAALGTARGYAPPEAQAAYDRALEVAWEAPRSADLFAAMQELASYYLSRGQLRTALQTAGAALEQVAGEDHLELLPAAYRTLGFARLLAGDFTGAGEALERSLAPYAVHRSLLQATPPALGIPLAETLSHLSLAEWFLGRPGQGLKHATDSLTLARRFNDPFVRVFTVYRASFLHVFRREPAATRELAHELVKLANRHGFLFFIAAGMFLEGQALTAQGRAAEGLQMMSGGLDGVWASGMEVGRPRNLALLAEACGRSQLVEQGLSLIKEGLAAVELTGEGHYEAELHRIQGELLRLAGDSAGEVEERLLAALALARRQGSVALELRSAVSLGRLWRDHGKKRQARELLETVYGRFDEGFDTADLKEAGELIAALS